MDELNNVQTIKEDVSKQTGVPSALLSGNTYEEIEGCAKALINYKQEYRSQFNKHPEEKPTTAEQFSEWMSKAHPSHTFIPADAEQETPNLMESEPVRTYPVIKDGGESQIPQVKDSTARQFAEWFNGSLGGCYW